jgi:two-component system, OmpR family, alkaline phosphatase synthesis response regulator PhoP
MSSMVNSNFHILIVDDEADIREILSYNLKKEGFNVSTASDGRMAIKMAAEIKPHIIILDIMMPEMDGIETCEKIRDNPTLKNTLITFLTARAEDYSQIAGFGAGGDDYITKPIKPKVLVSRIKALLKRYYSFDNAFPRETDSKDVLTLGNIIIDKEKYHVTVDNEPIALPKKEFSLLMLLTSKPSKVFTRDEIFNHIWGTDVFVGDRTIDVYIRKLREKIGEKHIVTMKGIGYKFEY